MPTLVVENLTFVFDPTVAAELHDRWQHYKLVWDAPPGGQKAMDVVAGESALPSSVTWLIEAKDFRVITYPPRPSHIRTLAETVRDKADHTLAGLAHAQTNALLPAEKTFATQALSTARTRVILHLEPHAGLHTALFPSGFAASVYQKLKRLVRHIDTNPLVLNIANTAAANVPWAVT